MVSSQSLYLVLPISSSLFLMMIINLVFARPTGLTLKLIHRDSPESPLYPGRNLTKLERMERAFQQMEARQQQLMNAASMNSSVRNNNNNNSISINGINPPVFFDREYIVSIGMGSFPGTDPHEEVVHYQPYYLLFDTASDLLWLQCEECLVCFNQDAPLFPWKTSTTYHPLPCDNRCPFECVEHDDPCTYRIIYADGNNSTGVFATETLTVHADNGDYDEIGDFVFGCGLNQSNFGFGEPGGKNPIAGILGLGGGPLSFVRQFGDPEQTRFEYCLVESGEAMVASTFLRFGSDTKIGGGGGGQVVQSTPMLFGRGPSHYYAKMIDISIDGKRIGYDGEFELHNDGTGGCLFDTGTQLTQLSTPVYRPLKSRLIEYFAILGVYRLGEDFGKLEVCFHKPHDFNRFPSVIFLFDKEAAFEIETESAFYIGEDFFCLNMVKVDEDIAVNIGGIQQANHRILFDLSNLRISWSHEECHQDS